MKATGYLRRIDDLGRVVIPKELRHKLCLHDGDPLELFIDEDSLVIRKYLSSCEFCYSDEKLTEYKGKHICANCLKELTNK